MENQIEKRQVGDYTNRELLSLEAYFTKHNLSSLKSICLKASYSTKILKEILEKCKSLTFNKKEEDSFSFDKKHIIFTIGNEEIQYNMTSTAKEFHDKVYQVLFITPFEDLPLEISDDELYNDLVKWRFERGF